LYRIKSHHITIHATQGGLDWRVPFWFQDLIVKDGVEVSLLNGLRNASSTEERTVRVRHQSYDGGARWYDGQLERDEPSFVDACGDVWRMMFTPAPAVAAGIKREMDSNGLVPGEYTSAHLRVFYAAKHRPKHVIKKWTRHSIDCASTLRPGKPIFLASDSAEATEYGAHYGRNVRGAAMVIHERNPDPPLHLDRGDDVGGPNSTVLVLNSERHPPSDYYDTFTDLYLLAMSGCIFYSKGGYGLWAILVSGNTPCRFQQRLRQTDVVNNCNFTKGPEAEGGGVRYARLDPMFLEPMDGID
jgi:hypothetical protein